MHDNHGPLTRHTGAYELAKDLLALLWPVECAGCAAPDRALCIVCETWLLRHHTAQEYTSVQGVPWVTLGPYEGLLRTLIIQFKHSGQTSRAGVLAHLLDRALTLVCSAYSSEGEHTSAGLFSHSSRVLTVPMPSRPTRVRQRGYRHLEYLLRRSHHGLGSAGWRALRTLPGRTGQVGLDPKERAVNAALLAVHPRARIAGTRIVLVDDIITTGATLTAATDVLRAHGAHVAGAVALAHARERKSVSTHDT